MKEDELYQLLRNTLNDHPKIKEKLLTHLLDEYFDCDIEWVKAFIGKDRDIEADLRKVKDIALKYIEITQLEAYDDYYYNEELILQSHRDEKEINEIAKKYEVK